MLVLPKKKAYIKKINLKWVECPICNRKGELIHYNEEIWCECGYVMQTPNQYVAGNRINTTLTFNKKKRGKKR